jgi:anaphase-promoting complex subunit 6
VEMDLDTEADGLLRRALGRVRPKQRRPPMTPEMDSETPAPSSGRSRGTRHGRSQSRQ